MNITAIILLAITVLPAIFVLLDDGEWERGEKNKKA